jgi:voltage-gated potassium channel
VFIFALSVISIVNIVLVLPGSPLNDAQRQVILLIDAVLTVFFVIDVVARLRAAPSWRQYLLRERGWLDVLGSLPGLRVLRIFRVVRAWTLMRTYGLRTMGGYLMRDRARSALYLITILVVVILEFTATTVLRFESGAPGANITTGGDALWWALVTVTTVGYGDQYPVTPGGRAVGVLLLLGGVVLFATLSGFLANAFLAPTAEEAEADDRAADDRATQAAAVREMLVLLRRQEEETAALRRRLEEMARPDR